MKQLRLEWTEQSDAGEREVVLDEETIEVAIELMARAMLTVVRAAEEQEEADER